MSVGRAWIRSAATFLLIIIGFGGGFVTGSAEARSVPAFLRPTPSTSPIQFDGIEATTVWKHQVVLAWGTDRAASGRVVVRGPGGVDRRITRMQVSDHHAVELDGLQEGSEYVFRVYAWRNNGEEIQSKRLAFRTRGTPPPAVRDIQLLQRHRFGGTIVWRTDRPTRGVLRAGHAEELLTLQASDREYRRRHRVTLEGFRPSQTVYYQIHAEDPRRRGTSTSVRSFRTRDNNVAFNRPVKGTFTEPIFGVPSKHRGNTPFDRRLNDGRYDYQYGTATSGDPAEAPQWFTVDLGREYVPSRIEMIWRHNAYPREYHLLGRTSGKKWTPIASALNAEEGTLTRRGGIPSYQQTVTVPEVDRAFRQIKLLIPQGAPYFGKYPQYRFVQLQEFKFYPRTTPELESRPSVHVTDRKGSDTDSSGGIVAAVRGLFSTLWKPVAYVFAAADYKEPARPSS